MKVEVILERNRMERKIYTVEADSIEQGRRRALRIEKGASLRAGEEEGEWEASNTPRNRVVVLREKT